LTQLWAGTSPQGAELNGKVNLQKQIKCSINHLMHSISRLVAVPHPMGACGGSHLCWK
jgi:hypothetical protein